MTYSIFELYVSHFFGNGLVQSAYRDCYFNPHHTQHLVCFTQNLMHNSMNLVLASKQLEVA